MPTVPLPLDRPALPVDVAPGAEVVLHGSFRSTHDGSILDAATTTWPAEAPGGASVDAGGLVDFEAGGFHVTSRDPVTHEVHAVATGDPAAACSALGLTGPCLPLRTLAQARARLMTVGDWTASLAGRIEVETIAPPVYAPAAAAAARWAAVLEGAGAALALAVIGAALWSRRKRRAQSPAGRLLALAREVRSKLGRADAVIAAPLAPAVEIALRSLEARRVDAGSAEGRRVRAALERVNATLDETSSRARATEEREAADELVREMESALEAAAEAADLEPGAPRR